MRTVLPRRHRRPLVAALAAIGTTASMIAFAPQSTAASADPGVVASGSHWSVTRAAGGYEVRLTLASPLPVRDDLPELVVDGTDLGPATESADGTMLSLLTTDPTVSRASDVDWQWSSGGKDTSPGATTLPAGRRTAKARVQKALSEDDPLGGTGAYTVADYNFGAQSIALANLGGVRGEVEGRIYLPSTSGEHPLVIFLHGRHSACYNTTTLRGSSAWPCPAGTSPILSYAGYDAAGDALAAKGYTVVSISANSINANDGSLGADAGAVARGQLVLDTLSFLDKANDGDAVSFHDAATNTDVSLDQALVAGQATLSTPTQLTAADLEATMDFSDIGLMGHSRGGEGVTTAAVLNEGLAHPWNIKSVFNLAPIDFTRATLPDVDMVTLLPYCDGDVSDQQGEHFYQDSRTAFDDDDVLRSNILVMGTDHDYYNTSWTPPYPAASDDWAASRTNDAVCGPTAPGTTRLSAADQDTTGAAYVAGFFQLTLGHDLSLQGMFDGSEQEPASVSSFADVRTVAQQPASLRRDLQSFEQTSPLVAPVNTMTAIVCASRFARTVPVDLASCPSPAVNLTTQQMPYWTPASYAPNVPLSRMTHLSWPAVAAPTTGAVSDPALLVTVPTAAKDMSAYQEMTFDMSPDDTVPVSTDMTVSVTDTAGNTWSSPVSALNQWAVTRNPTSAGTTVPGADSSGSTLEAKLILAQVHVPTATLSAAGVDVTSLARITFAAPVTSNSVAAGGVFVSDLGFDSVGIGTPNAHTRPTVNVASTKVEEGSGPGTDEVAAYLSTPSTKPISTYVSVIGAATGKLGVAVQKVTFAPGTTCQTVQIPSAGDTTAGTTASASYKFAVSDPTNAVLGKGDFGTVTVREDDGTVAPAPTSANPSPVAPTPLPAVGVQGDACAEYAALTTPGVLTASTSTPAPGGPVTLTGSGYRSGESVAFTLGSQSLGSATAGTDGSVTFTGTVPADAALGAGTVSAVGFGSGYTSTVDVTVKATTTTTLALDPSAPSIDQAATLTATVTGAGTVDGGTVTFTDGPTTLGTATVSDGTAALAVPSGFKAGDHTFGAVFGGTDTAAPSTANQVGLMLTRNASAIAVALGAKSYTYGHAVTGIVAVGGATEGTATVTVGTRTLSVPIGSTGAGSFSVPAGLAVGTYTVSAQYDGTDFVAPSGVSTEKVTITKQATTTGLLPAKATVAHGKAQPYAYAVKGRVGGDYPTGTVTVTATIAGKVVASVKVTLSAAAKGSGTVSFAIKTKGTAKLTARYAGNAAYGASTSPVHTVTVS